MKIYRYVIYTCIAVYIALSCNRQTRLNAIVGEEGELTDSCKYCFLLYATVAQAESTGWYNSVRESSGQEYYAILKDNLLFDCPDYAIDEKIKINVLSSEEIINNETKFFFYYNDIQITGDSAYVMIDCRMRTIMTHNKYKLTDDRWTLVESSYSLYRADPFNADDLLR